MKITWLGHSCFKVESDGYSAVLDPYADGSVPGLANMRETADIVLCSHGHDDHNAAGNVNLRGSGAAPFDVSFIDTWHDNVRGKMRGSNRVTILSDGKMTLVHMGDLGCDLTPAQYEEIGHPDVLLIPVGGFFTINAKQASAIADRIGARITVPMHFKSKSFGYKVIGTVDGFVERRKNVKKYGSELEITEDMPEQTAVMRPKMMK